MTLKKVAEIANVSVSTASKALKNSFDVSEETRKRVIAAAEKCGYFGEKKRISAENRKSSELTIAVICPEVISPHYSAMIEAITVSANKLSYNVVVYNASFDKERYLKILSSCFENTKIDAVINLSSLGKNMDFGKTPHIILSKDNPFGSAIFTDLDEGFGLIKSANPHWKKVCFASEKLTGSKEKVFLRTFVDGDVIVGDGRFESAGESVAEKLPKNALPDAVICAYDEIAFGLIDALQKTGVSVPNDIEVVGINNVSTSKWAFGGVSTLGFNHDEIFDEVLADITADIKSKSITKREYHITSRFFKRNTTK